MVVRTFLWLSLVSAAHGFLAPAPRALKPLSTRRGEALYASKAKQGLFSPAVEATKAIMGKQELLEFRAKVILEHSKVIGKFVDNSIAFMIAFNNWEATPHSRAAAP